MSRLMDLTGQRFGRLSVVKRGPNDKRKQTRWECVCDCGQKKLVYGYNLANGHTVSCGCQSFEKRTAARTTHHMSKTRIYGIWGKMKGRCLCKTDDAYFKYGGRGITVCDEWMSFEPFYEWARTHGYSNDRSIDRIDNDGNYCPENCRWTTAEKQANNTRRNRTIECFGETHTLAEWARKSGVRASTIAHRIKTGWTIEEALSTPVGGRGM